MRRRMGDSSGYIVFNSAEDYAKRVAIYDRKKTTNEREKKRKS
jgi:hypothetical protein